MVTLYKKELHYYLNNAVGYIIAILFALFSNFLFVKDLFVTGSASMQPFFSIIPWLLLIFIPAISMRMFAEEKRSNTLEVLLTLPVSETQIVISKFFALMTILGASLFLTLLIPIVLSLITTMYFPEILVGYLGILLTGSFFITVSLYISGKTKNQIVSFLGSIIIIFFLLVLSSDFTANVLPKFIQDVISPFMPLYQAQSFFKGIIDLRSFVYMVSGSILFLFLTIIDLEKRW